MSSSKHSAWCFPSGRALPLYLANAAHPLFTSIEQLFVAEAARVERIYDAVRQAAQASGGNVAAVWVYGRVTRGEDGSASDLGLAVVVPVDTSVESVVGTFRNDIASMEQAEHVHASVVGISDTDVHRLAAGDPWWVAMERDAIPLVGDHPSDYARRVHNASKKGATGRAGASRPSPYA